MGFGSAVNSGHVDANQKFSITGVMGTLGTADVSGTAFTLPIGVDPTTGAMFVNNLGASSSGGSNVNVITGTQQTLGTVGVVNNLVTGTLAQAGSVTGVGVVSGLTNGSINILTGTLQSSGTTTGVGVVTSLSGGTINTGSVAVTSLPSGGTILNLASGTLASVAMLNAGTITTLPAVSLTSSGTLLNLASGTLAAVTSITNLASGTLAAVTSVTNLASGTLAAVTSLTNLAAGTLTAVTSITNIVSGTLLNSGTTTGVGVVTALTNGSVNVLTGTMSVNTKQVGSAILTYGTVGTAGAATWGTLVAPVGAGTLVYLNGLSIVVSSGTVDCAITNNIAGSNGAGVYARGVFIAGGGIMRDFFAPIATGTNGTIAYLLNGAGTAAFLINYWVGP